MLHYFFIASIANQTFSIINSVQITEKNAEPEITLLTYLRRSLGLTGTKLGCAEGGCGACTVMVSKYHPHQNRIIHHAVNACLAPLCSLHHCAVTTVDGIGSVASKLHPVQERIAKAHGSQCGFCTPGIVMSMYALLRNNPRPSMHEIQEAFQGNLCRCTGYRPILEGYRTFTKVKEQLSKACYNNNNNNKYNIEVNCMTNQSLCHWTQHQEIIFPPELMVLSKQPQRELRFVGERVLWIQPYSLKELLELKATYPNAKLVVGNTEVGIEMKFKNLLYPVILAPAYIPELNIIQHTQDGIQVGASVTLTLLGDVLRAAVKKLPAHQTEVFEAVLEQLRWFAGQQIRNVAVCFVSLPEVKNCFIEVNGLENDWEKRVLEMDDKFFPGYRKTILKSEEILLSIDIPYTRKYFSAFKQSPRKEDDIAIVTCGMNVLFKEKSNIVQSIRISYGGMAPVTVLATATCNRLLNRQWNEELLEQACTSLAEEMSLSPSAPGGMVTYRRTLTISLFYKFFLTVQHKLALDLRMEVFNTLFQLDSPSSVQLYQAVPPGHNNDDVVGHPIMHLSALKHATGEAIYCDDIPYYENELHLALVTSIKAHALIKLVEKDTRHDAIANKSFYQPVRSIERGDVAQGFKDSDHILHGISYLINCPNANNVMCLPQALVAKALGVPANRVVCRVKRMGGGFGGKESRSTILSTVVAVAAHTVKQPVRCMLDRDEDMLVTGGRHPFFGHYKVGYMNNGRVMALDVMLYSNAGNSLDLSLSILERALFHMDNSYNIPNIHGTGYMCKTNLPSNSAFRGFGGPQGMMIAESWMSDVALSCGLPAEEVRRMNMYKEGDFTPFNQRLDQFTIDRCWEECMQLSDFNKCKEALEQYNRQHRWTKRGLSIIPTKFGISFTAVFLNQAGALVHVYSDGSVLLTHGGTEMRQGLHTKMVQVASKTLGIPCSKIHITETSTNTVPNTSPTAASASSDLNGMAIYNACQTLLQRLQPYKDKNLKGCWEDWVTAYFHRVNLSANGFYKYVYFSVFSELQPFNYFSYGVAVSEVEIDCLTGSHKNLHTSIVMDVGKSLNPALDIGQVEGGFMQGLGLFTLEELRYSPDGYLYTRGPGMYKIPSFGDIPIELKVSLLRDTPNEKAIFSSKAVGEPPLFLAASVFYAIKDAIIAARAESGLTGPFRLDSPATPERIRNGCEDKFTKLCPPADPGTFTPWAVQV
uniref:xanthine dehydrogenase n=1 Tax=Sinocyclocheilus anshuiensis TaxID=1608454 RepID=A0A671RBC4_9TELE